MRTDIRYARNRREFLCEAMCGFGALAFVRPWGAPTPTVAGHRSGVDRIGLRRGEESLGAAFAKPRGSTTA